MKVQFVVCLLFTILNGYCQNTTKIVFSNRASLPEKSLLKFPKELRKIVQQQTQNLKYETVLYFDSKNNFFEAISSKKETIQKGKVGTETVYPVLSNDDMSTTITTSKEKFIKNIQNQTLSELHKGTIVKKKLVGLKWRYTNNTKKILGYNCEEAIGTYMNQVVIVYVTKEISGISSPGRIAFIDGVILEYSGETKSGIATKITFKEPDIKDFLRN